MCTTTTATTAMTPTTTAASKSDFFYSALPAVIWSSVFYPFSTCPAHSDLWPLISTGHFAPHICCLLIFFLFTGPFWDTDNHSGFKSHSTPNFADLLIMWLAFYFCKLLIILPRNQCPQLGKCSCWPKSFLEFGIKGLCNVLVRSGTLEFTFRYFNVLAISILIWACLLEGGSGN